ncbi:MAG: caspase family protein [Lewinellaceae bacterium]|nr:caspase family protein [Lewinellaceae bacterium]
MAKNLYRGIFRKNPTKKLNLAAVFLGKGKIQIDFSFCPQFFFQYPRIMRRIHFLPILLVFGQILSGQDNGDQSLLKPSNMVDGTTRAVVIGISNYQFEAIPDLQFAHRDAEAFANYLKSKAGGSLTDNQIELLTNQEATYAQMYKALEWLLDESMAGDKAIIYFSGHGDTETKTISQRGFLLPYDSPPRSYGLGAYSVDFLIDIIETLSAHNVQVVLVSDACRAGKLAGEEYKGSQLTLARMKEKSGNEIKILSCQENEFSHEGPQWGGGRGVFSFHLVEGLIGMADTNRDLAVTLLEIEDYLQEKVPLETAPNVQVPITVGNLRSTVGMVDEQMLNELQKEKSLSILTYESVGLKGMEETIIATADTSVQKLYEAFLAAIQQGNLMSPEDQSANHFYEALIKEESIRPIHGYLKRDLVAALINGSQESLNRWIFFPEREMIIWFSPTLVRQKYGPFPNYLERAAELLGEGHYMYSHIMARKALFEGGIQYLQKIYWKDYLNGELALEQFRESLKWQPRAAHTYLWMAMTHFYNMQQRDSAYFYLQKAIEISPVWDQLYLWKAQFLIEERRFSEAKVILEEQEKIDPENAFLYNTWGGWYFYQGQYDKTIQMWDKAFALDSTSIISEGNKILSYGFMGEKEKAIEVFNSVVRKDSLSAFPHYFLGNMYYLSGQLESSIQPFEKAIYYDPHMIWAYSQLGDALIALERLDEAEKILLDGFALDSTYMPLVNALGGVYQGKGDLQKAEQMYLRAIELDGSNWIPFYNLASVYVELNRYDESLEYLEIAITKGLKYYYDYYLKGNESLDPLRELPEFKALMEKYFPGKD